MEKSIRPIFCVLYRKRIVYYKRAKNLKLNSGNNKYERGFIMKKACLIMMIGIPASGKSSIAKEIAKEFHFEILSADSIREELTGFVEDQTKNKEVFEIIYERLRDNLLKGNNVILDNTNINKAYRKMIFDKIDDIECLKIGYLCTKNEEDLHRDNLLRAHPVPDHIIDKFIKLFEMPSLVEGFDKIILD